MASGDDRHNARHNKKRRPVIRKWKRNILTWAYEADQLEPGARVRWQALLRRWAKGESGKSTGTMMVRAVKRLEDEGLVSVRYYGQQNRTPRARVESYRLTDRGHDVAVELQEHGGQTRAAVERNRTQTRTDAAYQAQQAWTSARRAAFELLMDDPELISELTRQFGPEPGLGDDSPVAEGAKRFLLLARSKFFQDFALKELEQTKDVLAAPGASGGTTVGIELAYAGDVAFDPNDPLIKEQLEMIRSVYESIQASPDSNAAGEATTEPTDD